MALAASEAHGVRKGHYNAICCWMDFINFSSLWGPASSSYSYVHYYSSLSTFCFVVKTNTVEEKQLEV